MQLSQLKNILIVSLDNIGDCVMATSVIRPIMKECPKVRISIWVKDYSADIFSGFSDIVRIHSCDPYWNKSPERKNGKIATFFRTLLEIRKYEYDVAIIFNSDWRRPLFCFIAGIINRLGYHKRLNYLFLSKCLRKLSENLHVIDQHKYLICHGLSLKEENINETLWLPYLKLTEEESCWGESQIQKWEWDNKSIVSLHPFSGCAKRDWPAEKWVELIELLSTERDTLRFAVMGTSGQTKAIENLISHSLLDKCQFISDNLPLIKAILTKSKLLIGVDSGIGHIAAALGTPVISLFGPSNPAFSAPRGTANVKVIKKSPITSLTADEVSLSALDVLLNR